MWYPMISHAQPLTAERASEVDTEAAPESATTDSRVQVTGCHRSVRSRTPRSAGCRAYQRPPLKA